MTIYKFKQKKTIINDNNYEHNMLQYVSNTKSFTIMSYDKDRIFNEMRRDVFLNDNLYSIKT